MMKLLYEPLRFTAIRETEDISSLQFRVTSYKHCLLVTNGQHMWASYNIQTSTVLNTKHGKYKAHRNQSNQMEITLERQSTSSWLIEQYTRIPDQTSTARINNKKPHDLIPHIWVLEGFALDKSSIVLITFIKT